MEATNVVRLPRAKPPVFSVSGQSHVLTVAARFQLIGTSDTVTVSFQDVLETGETQAATEARWAARAREIVATYLSE